MEKKSMPQFNSNNYYPSQSPISRDISETFSTTKKYLQIRRNFIQFQDWLSDTDSIASDEEDYSYDIPSELDEIFNDEQLLEELEQLEEQQVESTAVLVACPKNMPKWKNAWWGEKVLQELRSFPPNKEAA